ncbi:NADP-dependent oxidoreductase [Hyphococcus flavus]|uniref:NADP-dependent oxidoreductase n=1 Tax=Hyphococcus flavus TaxID=1866326 RepID=A0AAE9ZFB4_9PROT|nr:NADP-dependent oxidoreductase [Hyphococcus flavus]WDI31682.1 NADP-dependent oxidoreductase [Hyphococcus flavus]
MSGQKTKAVYLKEYPAGMPADGDFVVKEMDVPSPGAGEMLCRTVWMSVDPYMRGRMRPDVKSYIPPFSLDAPLEGGAVSEVIESNIDGYATGDYVVDFTGGWKEYYLSKGERSQKVDPNLAPLSAYLGVLGMPGLTAWAGVTQILEPKEGETLFVSGAAGAVGSLVCQLGKIKGCRVIGSAGSKEKCDWLEKEAGVDVALNYKDYKNAGELTKALAAAAPKGVNCYFENVGGMHLEAALNCSALGGRMALCGMIAVYNNKEPEPGPSNLINMVGRGVMARGFIVSEYMDKAMEFAMEVAPLLAQGKIKFQESVYEGLDKAPEAFIGLFKGENMGKAVIRVGPDRL